MRRWHWQIDQLEQGPDYVFKMTFLCSDSARLHQLVREHLPPHYVTSDIEPRPARFSQAAAFSGYVDAVTYARCRAMQTSGIRQSIYHYGQIEVIDHEVHIRHVLAGGMYDESGLILSLLRAPELTLTYWHVAFAGYQWGDVASGRCATTLLEYLDA